MKLGFIGLGNMGGPMARNLLKAGHQLTVHDLDKKRAVFLLEEGAHWADTPARLAQECDIVFTSLPGPTEVAAVAIGPNSILQGIAKDGIYIDLSTSSPTLVRRIATMFQDRDAHVLDAPVSGGVPGAQAGTLAVLASGDKAIYDKCEPVLQAIGDKVRYCGQVGSGTICKLMHNCIGYSLLMAAAECFTVAVKAGVDPKVVWEAVCDGSVGRGTLLNIMLPRTLFRGSFKPDFALELAKKDVMLATEVGRELGVPMKASNLTLQELMEGVNRGWGDQDSRIFMTLQEERAGVQLRFPEAED